MSNSSCTGSPIAFLNNLSNSSHVSDAFINRQNLRPRPLYTQVIHFYLLFLTNLSIYRLNKVLSTEHCNFRFFLHFLPSHFIYTISRYKGPVSLLFLSASDPLLLLLFLSIFSVLHINIPQSNFRKIFIPFFVNL